MVEAVVSKCIEVRLQWKDYHDCCYAPDDGDGSGCSRLCSCSLCEMGGCLSLGIE